MNTKAAPEAVEVDASDSLFSRVLPASISQFFSPQDPKISFGSPTSVDVAEAVKFVMRQLISGERYNELSKTHVNNMQLLSLYEYEGTVIKSITKNFVAVGISFSEDENSGDALYCEIVLEQIRFVAGKSDELPKDVVDGLRKKASALEDKGKMDSSTIEVDTDNIRVNGTALRDILLNAGK